MKHYLGLIDDEHCMATELGPIIRWMKMVKNVEIEVCPEVVGTYQVILVKEKGKKGESFNAVTYKKLMEKVNDLLVR